MDVSELDEDEAAAVAHHRSTLKTRPNLPVVALDLDGVLNPVLLGLSHFVVHEIDMKAKHLPKSPFLRGKGLKDLDGVVQVNEAHGKWIADLVTRADVYWATTWEGAANVYFAPLLGIEPLPVIEHSKWAPTFGELYGGNVGRWKWRALQMLFPKRPLVWIDDMAHISGVSNWLGKDKTLVIRPDPEVGISARQMRQVDVFVAKTTLELASNRER